MDFTYTTLLYILLGTVLKEKQKTKRKVWARKWLLRRKQKGCYEIVMKELALEDAEGYRRWLCMDTATFEFLLTMVTPYISGKDTNMWKTITPGEKLAVTLRYLASGETQSSLAYQFRISQNTISGILKLVCSALVTVLKNIHLCFPSSKAEWAAISAAFDNMWQFPMCVGALDGKHVKISPLALYATITKVTLVLS
ncbi:hypothetical protein AVEN_170152-1 [Araneus ventricosus]|uniref:DDE Tnp4 domain-containing protein n=1 Tax=Araneus ventricosus TaxID=182803 RepID=A0A4Y2NR86_ARAVE|nr:hypothetical protein AVEN_170152-1 [Araneus ventricosus]